MERIAFDLVITKKGNLFNILNEKIIGYIGFAGLLSILSFSAIYYKIYEINLLDFAVIKLFIFLFSVCIFITIARISGDVDGTYVKKEGLLCIDENEIIIDYTIKYPITEITYIKFNIMNFLEPTMFVYVDGHTRRYAGTGNYLEFEYEQKTYTYQFIIDSEGHKRLLIEKLIPQLQTNTKVTYVVY